MTGGDVVVVHPGVQHSADLAASLHRAGRLNCLVTRLQIGSGAPRAWQSLTRWLPRRVTAALADQQIRRVDTGYEFVFRGVGSRLPLSLAARLEQHFGDRFNDRTLRLLDPRVHVVVGTDTASLALFRRLEQVRPDITRVLDISHPLDAVVQPLIREDARRWSLPLKDYDDFHDGPVADQRPEIESADAVLVASSFSARAVAAAGIAGERVFVVPYAVSRNDRTRRPFSGRLSLLALGAMSERKGMSLLLEAMRSLENAPVDLVLAGKPAGEYRLPSTLPANTTYVGSPSHDQVATLLTTADVLVLPSMCEGFGRTLLEALAAGTSVITTERSGGPDILAAAPQAPLTVLAADARDGLADLILDHFARPERYLRPDDARAAAREFSEERYVERLSAAMDAAANLAAARRAGATA